MDVLWMMVAGGISGVLRLFFVLFVVVIVVVACSCRVCCVMQCVAAASATHTVTTAVLAMAMRLGSVLTTLGGLFLLVFCMCFSVVPFGLVGCLLLISDTGQSGTVVVAVVVGGGNALALLLGLWGSVSDVGRQTIGGSHCISSNNKAKS